MACVESTSIWSEGTLHFVRHTRMFGTRLITYFWIPTNLRWRVDQLKVPPHERVFELFGNFGSILEIATTYVTICRFSTPPHPPSPRSGKWETSLNGKEPAQPRRCDPLNTHNLTTSPAHHTQLRTFVIIPSPLFFHEQSLILYAERIRSKGHQSPEK